MDVDRILSGLNEPQIEAVQHIDGPLLVLAGAGSGKTRVITRRVAYLISQGVAPRQILAITFTNKAAEEMRQRVAGTGVPRGSTVCTFHSLCARLLREFADLAGLDPRYSIYDRDDQLKIVKQAMEKLHLTSHYMTPAGVHGTISNAKNALQTPQAFAGQAGNMYEREAAEVYARYEKLLAANNAVDFDDLLLRMAFLLRDRSDVREFLGRRYRYVLIDEYQDTNHAQYILAHGIALEHQNLCATGDPDQSIYAWRGADINNILDFEKDYPQAKVVRLEENYRSRAPILAAASSLIDHNTQRKAKTLFTRKEGGEDVRVVTLDDEHAEARYVADRIDEHRLDGGAYGDVAIFYRVNSLSRVLEEALLRKGVPYAIARGVEFYNRKEIKDVLAYLKLLVNPADDLSCLRIINTPPRGIGKTTVDRLQAAAMMRGWSVLEATRQADALGLKPAATKKLQAFGEMIHLLAADLDRSVRDVLEDVYRRTGMEEAYGKDDEESRQAKSNVDELLNTAVEFDAQRAALAEAGGDPQDAAAVPLADYLHQIALVSDADHMEGAAGMVTLMTLHAAKGLEFPVVFVVGCEEGMLPFQRATDGFGGEADLAKLEEERRLAFVGMTRAKERLTLSSVRMRMVRGQRDVRTASPFLTEIGDENVTRDDRTTDSFSRRPARGRRGGFFREASPDEERAVIEAMPMDAFDFDDGDDEPMPPEYEYLRVGCMVRHARFGLGKLTKLSGRWPETRATVLFHEVGQKKLALAHTSLEIADAPF